MVGASGSGKSTLADLIPRFFEPTEGSLKLDKIDIKDVRIKSLRKLMGIVTQETILFNDTISGNIAYGQMEIDPRKIHSAAEAANASEFIDSLPEGYNTVIGEKGVRLSGGQRHWILNLRNMFRKLLII